MAKFGESHIIYIATFYPQGLSICGTITETQPPTAGVNSYYPLYLRNCDVDKRSKLFRQVEIPLKNFFIF